ncbi:serine/threonine-protein kinase DCLK1-like [Diadema antillarum]|uniref:serine/threonine-protein kinase DCLK1-like n=1 Tax=Diadema antillarum TaxID=105358 RepID=UPI003A88FC4D
MTDEQRAQPVRGWMPSSPDTLVPYPIPINSLPRAVRPSGPRKSDRRLPFSDPPTAMASMLSPRSLPSQLSPRSDPLMISPRTMATASRQLQELTHERYQEMRRPRHVYFYRNGDRFFKGKRMLITPHRYTSFEDLLSELTRNMKLPYGVRQIFTPKGSKIRDIQELKDGESYVCASFERLKRIKYGSSSLPHWNLGGQRKHQNNESHLYAHIPVGFSYPPTGKYAGTYGRSTFGTGHSGPGSFAYNRGNAGESVENESKAIGILHSDRSPIKPKVVKIVKTGSRPRKVVSLLINKRSVQSYEQLIQDISDAFGYPKYKNNRIRKLYTLRGKEVKSLADFYRDKDGVLIASPSRTSLTEETVVDIYEELYPDSSYSQFARKKKGKKKDVAKLDSGISEEDEKNRKSRRARVSKDSDSRGNDSRGSDYDEIIHERTSDTDRKRKEGEDELDRRKREEKLQDEVKRREEELQQREEELRRKEEEMLRKEKEDRERKDREREEELARKEAELKEKEEKLKSKESEDAKKLQELLEADAQRKIEGAELKAQARAEREAREAAERRANEEAAKREEAERRARKELEKRAKEEDELKKREESARRARLEAEMTAKEQAARRASAERRAREEAKKRLQQEERVKEQEEAERQAKEAERIAREEAESRAMSEKQAREEAERKAKEAEEYKEAQEEERRKREEAERLAQLEAELRREAERRAEEEKHRKGDDDGHSESASPRDENENITYKENDTEDSPVPESEPEERFVRQPRTLVKKTHILEKYSIGTKIGDGNFADVHEATHVETDEMYAMKIIEKAKLKNKEHMVENEIAIMRYIRHPNIVRLYEEFETRGHIYLVMEYVSGGDLFDAITESVKFTEGDAALMVEDLASALAYLHDLNVVHRDLKPENLLVNKSETGDITLKLADFGLAMEVKEPIFTVCGTPTYVAPEILAETGYGLEVDMWALGVITYILLCGFPPFRSPDRDQEELFELIQAGHFEYISPYWDNISKAAKDLIDHLLVVDVKMRYKAKQVLKHPWVAKKGATGRQPNLQREVSMNLEKNFKGRRSAKRKAGGTQK